MFRKLNLILSVAVVAIGFILLVLPLFEIRAAFSNLIAYTSFAGWFVMIVVGVIFYVYISLIIFRKTKNDFGNLICLNYGLICAGIAFLTYSENLSYLDLVIFVVIPFLASIVISRTKPVVLPYMVIAIVAVHWVLEDLNKTSLLYAIFILTAFLYRIAEKNNIKEHPKRHTL